MSMILTDQDKEKINNMESIFAYKQTWAFQRFIHCPEKIIGLFCGNQSMKTSGATYQYVLRILGIHPVPEKNVSYFECISRSCRNGHRYRVIPKDMICQKCGEELSKSSGHKFIRSEVPGGKIPACPKCGMWIKEHIRGSRIIRFASETLPNEKDDTGKGSDSQSAEIKNTVYPEFKKWLPRFLVKKDITFRNPSMTIIDPYGGNDIIVEFTSYNQPIQAGAGVQRMSILLDEEPPFDFWKEQLPRLLAEDGDAIIALTAANQMTWTFDEIFEKARIYYRTEAISKFIGRPQIEKTDSTLSIAVIQAATDDNPTLDKNVIERMFENYDDPDVIATRRYGVFKQSTGRIFNGFDYSVHFIDRDRYFPNGIYHNWLHCRMEDYHESVNLAIVWIALSPEDEAFVYCDWNPSPEKIQTIDIAHGISARSKDYKYSMNLIDPLAVKTQSNTGLSVVDDMNRFFRQLKRDGSCEGGFWEAWDTKSTRGRDEIRKRLKNAKDCGIPFNNKRIKDQLTVNLPTLWILNNCKLVAESLKKWRKNEKGEPEQRHSHFCTAIEAVMKDSRFRPRKGTFREKEEDRSISYFQGARV